MITLCYNLYAEHEIYAMEYKKKINNMNDHLFLKSTMSKWCDDILWEDIVR